MPLSQNDPSLDYPGSWGDASKNWPRLVFLTEDEANKACALAWKEAKVPYGCYVSVDRELRLETNEWVAAVCRVLYASV